MAPWISGIVCAVLVAVVIIGMHLDMIIPVFSEIFQSAFGLNEAFAGTAGGFVAALMNGVKRGLHSNEAGMGSAPNAASTATTIHPARQGMIQSLGVFIDTILVCSATAFIILVSGVYTPGQDLEGATLTTASAVATLLLGKWAFGILADYEAGKGETAFTSFDNPHLPGEYEESIWTKETTGQAH